MRLLAYLYLLCQSGALFTIPPTEQIYHVIITPLAPTTATVIVSTTYTTSLFSETTQNIESIKIRFPIFTLTNMAPLSRNALEMRQKYLNDQGIGMDCGAWTGSHCTRVLPAKEAGRATEVSKVSSISYDNNGGNSIMPLAISYIILMNLITLWAAMSLA